MGFPSRLFPHATERNEIPAAHRARAKERATRRAKGAFHSHPARGFISFQFNSIHSFFFHLQKTSRMLRYVTCWTFAKKVLPPPSESPLAADELRGGASEALGPRRAGSANCIQFLVLVLVIGFWPTRDTQPQNSTTPLSKCLRTGLLGLAPPKTTNEQIPLDHIGFVCVCVYVWGAIEQPFSTKK